MVTKNENIELLSVEDFRAIQTLSLLVTQKSGIRTQASIWRLSCIVRYM